MKLTFSPGSPFARKVRIAAIELGLMDRIEPVPATVAPTQPNPDYAHDINPLRKLPALILDDGQVLVDSGVITDYLNDLGGGHLIPASGPKRWQVLTDHALIQGMTDAMLLCRYEIGVRPQEFLWQGWVDDQWDRAWQGLARFETHSDITTRPMDMAQIALVCTLGYADFRFPDCGWRQAFPKLDAFHERMLQRESVRISVPPKG